MSSGMQIIPHNNEGDEWLDPNVSGTHIPSMKKFSDECIDKK